MLRQLDLYTSGQCEGRYHGGDTDATFRVYKKQIRFALDSGHGRLACRAINVTGKHASLRDSVAEAERKCKKCRQRTDWKHRHLHVILCTERWLGYRNGSFLPSLCAA